MKHMAIPKAERGSQAKTSRTSSLRLLTGAGKRATVVGLVLLAAAMFVTLHRPASDHPTAVTSKTGRQSATVHLPPDRMASLTIAAAERRSFRRELTTEGRIAVDDNRATPVYAPFAGRVLRLLAKPGDVVAKGQPMLLMEVSDAVQMHNDLVAASSALRKARSQLSLAEIVEKRQSELYRGNAVPLKDFQQATNDLATAGADLRSAEAAHQAARNRLRLIGRADEEIDQAELSRAITAEAALVAPLAGTVLQRKAGPGQYVYGGSTDPLLTVGDLKSVWVVAQIRETDAFQVQSGQIIEVRPIGLPGQVLRGQIDYVSPAVDPVTRRVAVRATIDNPDGLLKLEMFATVSVIIDERQSVGVPRDAVIYDGGDRAHVWIVAPNDRDIRRRAVRPRGMTSEFVDVGDALAPGDRVVVNGALRIDRAAAADKS